MSDPVHPGFSKLRIRSQSQCNPRPASRHWTWYSQSQFKKNPQYSVIYYRKICIFLKNFKTPIRPGYPSSKPKPAFSKPERGNPFTRFHCKKSQGDLPHPLHMIQSTYMVAMRFVVRRRRLFLEYFSTSTYEK